MKKKALFATSLLSVLTLSGCSAETIEQAGLNTLLGMGMAFFVLILIMCVIYLFPVVLGTGEKKNKKKTEQVTTEQSIENTITQIVANEEQENDAELVAVIAAAIAAYEGSTSTDGFQVRSIRKRGKANGWKNAY